MRALLLCNPPPPQRPRALPLARREVLRSRAHGFLPGLAAGGLEREELGHLEVRGDEVPRVRREREELRGLPRGAQGGGVRRAWGPRRMDGRLMQKFSSYTRLTPKRV